MEARMKKYRQVSPERAKVWTEKSPQYHHHHHHHHNHRHSHQPQQQPPQNKRKVPVVYYLCRNRQLEHPHFMEVPLFSPDGLYLRDVIERLNVLRGRGMASLYSWSCKRSYKNGFVWHDLGNDDLILPAHGNEYVLKGSELFDESISGNFSSAAEIVAQTLRRQKALPEPPLSSRSHDESSSSSSLNLKNSNDDNSSPPDRWDNSLVLAEYKVYKTDNLSDAATQTDDPSKNTCTRGVSTDDNITTTNINNNNSNHPTALTDTLESLIKADGKTVNSSQIHEEEVEEEEEVVVVRAPPPAKMKASDVILQLISCGSISVKDHNGFGIVPSYRSRFSSLVVARAADGSEDKEFFSGSLVEMSIADKDGLSSLKRSSSFNADKSVRSSEKTGDNEEEEGRSTRTKCIPLSIKASLSKQLRCESMRSPLSTGPRISSDRAESSRTTTPGASNGGSKRMTEPLRPSEDSEGVIKIEESLLRELGL